TTTLTQTSTDPALPPGQQTQTATFDSRGNPIETVDNLSHETLVTYEHDRPTTITQVIGAPGGDDDVSVHMTYDDKGNVLTTTDNLGHPPRIVYGDFGQPTDVSDPLGNNVHNEYDKKGNLTRTVSATGVASEFQYDSHGNLKLESQGNATTRMD